MNSLENLRTSWKPRGPSARLKGAIFSDSSRPGLAVRMEAPFAILSRWLAAPSHALGTTAACVLLMAGVVVNVIGEREVAAGSFPLLAVGFSNQSWAASVALAHAPHNSCSAPILGWTKDLAFPSTNRSFEALNTNHPLPKL